MPANLTPEYKAAESAYRKARDPKERLEWLREMLRTMPKHKGTDHLQAQVKTQIKELTDELAGPRKGAARGGPAVVVRPEGAAQIALLGPPNAGKSALHDRLTGSGATATPQPYTTHHPQPGMFPFEDIHFQLVDLPPLAPEHPVPWLLAALQPADACLLVVDPTAPDCLEQIAGLHQVLAARRVTLSPRWDPAAATPEEEEARALDPFAVQLPTLLLANKADLCTDPEQDLAALREMGELPYPALAVSARTGAGLGALGPWLFERLQVVRVYTKVPGKPRERDRPFPLRRGQTVGDVAHLVHREMASHLKYARLWRGSEVQGLHVGKDHPLADGDVLELHA